MELEQIGEDNCKIVKTCLFPYSNMILYFFISWGGEGGGHEFKALNDMTQCDN